MIFAGAIVATVLSYTWLLAPITPRWTAAAAAFVVLTLAAARAVRTGEWGLARREFLAASTAAAAFTALAGGVVAIAGWLLNTWHARPSWWADAPILIPWALGQQFALQTVLLRESQQGARPGATIVAAALFAALHLPNPFLTAATFVGAIGWCWIYDRHPNVVPLALSHAALTLIVLCALDDATTGRLRVGAAYVALPPLR
jgi:membrane protease YdiL (CAAX protease family)